MDDNVLWINTDFEHDWNKLINDSKIKPFESVIFTSDGSVLDNDDWIFMADFFKKLNCNNISFIDMTFNNLENQPPLFCNVKKLTLQDNTNSSHLLEHLSKYHNEIRHLTEFNITEEEIYGEGIENSEPRKRIAESLDRIYTLKRIVLEYEEHGKDKLLNLTPSEGSHELNFMLARNIVAEHQAIEGVLCFLTINRFRKTCRHGSIPREIALIIAKTAFYDLEAWVDSNRERKNYKQFILNEYERLEKLKLRNRWDFSIKNLCDLDLFCKNVLDDSIEHLEFVDYNFIFIGRLHKLCGVECQNCIRQIAVKEKFPSIGGKNRCDIWHPSYSLWKVTRIAIIKCLNLKYFFLYLRRYLNSKGQFKYINFRLKDKDPNPQSGIITIDYQNNKVLYEQENGENQS